MNLQQQQHFVDNFCEKMKSTILGKGNDYANADRLSNFKLAGAICGLAPEQNCLSMIATKVARLGVLLGGKTPNNESIEDSLLDLANYAVLLGCIREEIGFHSLMHTNPELVPDNLKGPDAPKGPSKEWLEGWKSVLKNKAPGSPSLGDLLSDEYNPTKDFGVQESNTFAGSTIEGYTDELVKIGKDDR